MTAEELAEAIWSYLDKRRAVWITHEHAAVEIDGSIDLLGLANAILKAQGESEAECRMASALRSVREWAKAYPVEACAEPDFAAIDKILTAHGHSMTAMHWTWGRHITQGMLEIAESGLADPESTKSLKEKVTA